MINRGKRNNEHLRLKYKHCISSDSSIKFTQLIRYLFHRCACVLLLAVPSITTPHRQSCIAHQRRINLLQSCISLRGTFAADT